MHIAIGLWGIVRSLRYTIDSIQQYCLDPIVNGGHTYEIFMHTYRFSGVYQNNRSREVGVQLNFSEWNLISPDHVYVEDQDLFDEHVNYTQYQTLGDPWKNDYVSFANHIRALNSLNYLATRIEKESKVRDYDGVVFLRPDATYLNELPYYLLEHFPNTLFLPDFHRSCQGGEYNDRMAMGDVKNAVLYGKRFEHALEYSLRKPLHSETFTYDYLTSHNVTVKEIPFRFKRTRANGEHHSRDDTAIVSPRQQKPEQEYTTAMALRMVYTLLEELTENKVYIWNHDDHENLYCKPHPYITFEQCMAYRKKSRHMRWEKEIKAHNGQLRGMNDDEPEFVDPDRIKAGGDVSTAVVTAEPAGSKEGLRSEDGGVYGETSYGQQRGRVRQEPTARLQRVRRNRPPVSRNVYAPFADPSDSLSTATTGTTYTTADSSTDTSTSAGVGSNRYSVSSQARERDQWSQHRGEGSAAEPPNQPQGPASPSGLRRNRQRGGAQNRKAAKGALYSAASTSARTAERSTGGAQDKEDFDAVRGMAQRELEMANLPRTLKATTSTTSTTATTAATTTATAEHTGLGAEGGAEKVRQGQGKKAGNLRKRKAGKSENRKKTEII